MKQGFATLLGFITASVIPAVVVAATTDWPEIPFLLRVALFYPYALLATLLLGAPTFLLVRRFRLVGFWSSLAFGVLIGALVAVLVGGLEQVSLRVLFLFSAMGASSALAFWLLWKQGNQRLATGVASSQSEPDA